MTRAPERETRIRWSSKGEVVRTGATPRDSSGEGFPALAPAVTRKETNPTMATKDKAQDLDAFSRTPGAVGEAQEPDADTPLRVAAAPGGPRDALILDGHNDQDYVPDVDTKGYHSGLVRQPALPIVDGSGRIVGFQAVDSSMFALQPTIRDLKAAHNERESSKEWAGGIRDLSKEVAPVATPADVARHGGTPKAMTEAQNPANAGAVGAGPKAKS